MPTNSTAACPLCGKATAAPFQPFCSQRCADVDLGRWLTGQYVVPAQRDDEDPPPPDPLAG